MTRVSEMRARRRRRREPRGVRTVRTSLELFRDDNVALDTAVGKLVHEYHQIMGGVTVDFEGQQLTPKQLSPVLMGSDRTQREAAWRAISARRAADADRLEEVFDRLLELRQRIASNTGLETFRDYQWRALQRFDYSVEDCLTFHAAVEKYALPVLVLVTSWLQQKLLTPPTTGDTQSQAAMMNKQMQIMMPLMFMFFTLQYATGLSIYFVLSSVIRVVQYYLVGRHRDSEKAGSKE